MWPADTFPLATSRPVTGITNGMHHTGRQETGGYHLCVAPGCRMEMVHIERCRLVSPALRLEKNYAKEVILSARRTSSSPAEPAGPAGEWEGGSTWMASWGSLANSQELF